MIKCFKYILIIATCLIAGCYTSYFHSKQGTLTNVGLHLPNGNIADVQIASYLNGHIINVKDKSKISYSWVCTSTNSYFGLITTSSNTKGKINIDE
jgi:hypothetical protein